MGRGGTRLGRVPSTAEGVDLNLFSSRERSIIAAFFFRLAINWRGAEFSSSLAR